MSEAAAWVEQSAYAQQLGILIESFDDDRVVLALPYREMNSNPGGALHGGVYAALSVVGAQAVARTALAGVAGNFHTAGLQINYLAAAIEEGVTAYAQLLRRGKELCFVQVGVRSGAGRDVSQATLMIRNNPDADAQPGPERSWVTLGDEPGKMGAGVTRAVPFIHARGLSIQHMDNGEARLAMPWQEAHGDAATGGVHEGAMLALLDTAGAMAGWALSGPGAYKASTPCMQAQVLTPPPRADLVAHARVVHRDNEIFYSDVEVSDDHHRVCARGTILYRIVT